MNFLLPLQQPNFRLNQIKEWLWQKGAHGFNEMTNLPISLRQALHLHFEIRHGQIYEFQKAQMVPLKMQLNSMMDKSLKVFLFQPPKE